MDIMSIGLDLGVIAGIMGITEAVKRLDSDNRLKRYYVLIPLFLGVVAALVTASPFALQAVGKQALIYVGVSTYLYTTGKKLMFGPQDTPPAANGGL